MKTGEINTKWLFCGILSCIFCIGMAITVDAQPRGSAAKEICHFTGEAAFPYERIAIRPREASAHLSHGDVRPQNGICPSVLPMNWRGGQGKRTTDYNRESRSASPSVPVSATSSTVTGQNKHNADATYSDEERKVSICHRESDGRYNLITVSLNAVEAHTAHGDLNPELGSCFDGGTGGGGVDAEPGATPEPITMMLFGVGLAGIGYANRRRLATRT